tara:strand:+ start:185 stop:5254 length:5070 start_codon:yes stop_codon:yes gene_type:complete
MKFFNLLISFLLLFCLNINSQTLHTVNSGSYYYTPSNFTINVGDTVHWVNDGGLHNVNFDINSITGSSFNNPESFISSPTTGTNIYTHVFTIPGNYDYDCSVGAHAQNGMVGSISVNSTSGCTDSSALNYDSLATVDDGSCLYIGCNWSLIGQDIDGESADNYSGHSVSLSSDGSIVAVGAYGNSENAPGAGHVRVFENIAGTWIQIGQDIDGEAANDLSGDAISLNANGDILAIGAPRNDGNGSNSGHVRVFENISGTWTQIGQDIDGESASDNFGSSVSLNSTGDLIAIGATANDGSFSNAGHVRVFYYAAGTWTQIGQDIDGEAWGDQSGFSVSLSANSNIVAIGAKYNDGNSGSGSGHVRVYELNSGTWTQIGQDIDGEAQSDGSGCSVSLSENGYILAIGATGNDANGSGSGHVRVYELNSGTWTQIGQDIDGEYAGDNCGYSVSLSSNGNIIATGEIWNDDNGNRAGQTRVFKNINGVWTQSGQDILGESAEDYSGTVALSSDGSIISVGAKQNDGNGSNSGHVRVFTIVSNCECDNSVYVSINSCNNYIWNGVVYSFSGMYSNIFTDINGCDSTVFLDLTIGTISTSSSFSITSCDSYNWDGVTYYSTGLYTNVYNAYNGCDSTVILDLIINNSSIDTLSITSCDSYFWDGLNYTTSGFYTNVYTDFNGCDSTVVLNLTINNSSSSIYTIDACDSYFWGGVTYSVTGLYTNIYTGNNGCDSIASIDLTINNSSLTIETIIACDTTFYWDGVTYDSTGLYTNVYTDLNGCDSTVLLDLTIGISGCTDTIATNYNSNAICDDGSCYYCDINNNFVITNPTDSISCDGFIIANTVSSYTISSFTWYDYSGNIISSNNFALNLCNGVYFFSSIDSVGCIDSDTLLLGTIFGCTDSLALNYNLFATVDNGSCIYPTVYGCIDSLAYNYNPLANTDDGSCLYCDLTNTMIISQNSPGQCNGVILANSSSSNLPISYLWNNGNTSNNIFGLCSGIYSITITDNVGCVITDSVFIGVGCTDPLAYNYDSLALFDDGSCLYSLTYVPDNNFENFLEANGMGDGILLNDSVITSNISLVDSLNISYLYISDLTGLQDFISLTYLNCKNNILSVIDLSSNYNLNYLDCSFANDGNPLSNLNISSLTNLSYLNCEYNYLSSLDISQNNNLNYLNCGSNSLNYLDVSNNNNLNYLNCEDNLLTNLDITNNLNLSFLNFASSSNFPSNNISNIDLTNNLLLTSLICGGNPISTIDLSNNILLENLIIINDPIWLMNNISNIDLTNNVNLKRFDSDYLGLTSLDLSQNTSLERLKSTNNQLMSLDLTSNNNLTYLNCNYNQLTDLDLRNGNNISLTYMSTYNNQNLTCISVDDPSWSINNWTSIDSWTIFSNNCNSNCTSPKPTGLYSFDVIDTRAKIGWDNMNDSDCMVWKYFVRYREVGTNGWTTKSAGVGNGLCNFGLNTVTKQLLNLNPSTTYEFRMKAFYCGGTSSNYSTPVQFTTADPCPDMTNLTTTIFNSNQSKVRFNWDTTGAYTFARILLRVDVPGSNWQTAGGFGVYYPQLFVNKFGLTPGQSYRAQGRTFCDSNITAYRSPTWTAPIFWTQPGSIREGGGLSINNLDIYPNPSRDVFNITFNSNVKQNLRIRILSVVGAEVYREDRENFIGEYTKQVSLDNYGKGIYFLEIETNDGIINKKLILQ